MHFLVVEVNADPLVELKGKNVYAFSKSSSLVPKS